MPLLFTTLPTLFFTPFGHSMNMSNIFLVLVWLVFELSIFRDSSFKTPWLYTLVMFAIGLLYFLSTRPRPWSPA
jgi:hypothetical protein